MQDTGATVEQFVPLRTKGLEAVGSRELRSRP